MLILICTFKNIHIFNLVVYRDLGFFHECWCPLDIRDTVPFVICYLYCFLNYFSHMEIENVYVIMLNVIFLPLLFCLNTFSFIEKIKIYPNYSSLKTIYIEFFKDFNFSLVHLTLFWCMV